MKPFSEETKMRMRVSRLAHLETRKRRAGEFARAFDAAILHCLKEAKAASSRDDQCWWWGRAAGFADAWMLLDGTSQSEAGDEDSSDSVLAELIVEAAALRAEAENR